MNATLAAPTVPPLDLDALEREVNRVPGADQAEAAALWRLARSARAEAISADAPRLARWADVMEAGAARAERRALARMRGRR